MHYAKYYLHNEKIATILMTLPTLVTFGMSFVMYAESVDIGFMVKMGMALTGVIGAQVLKFGGYVENVEQTEAALRSIRLNYMWLPAALAGVVLVLVLFYDLDKKYETIMSELRTRRK